MSKQVSVLGNLRIAGAVVVDKDELDFPSNPKPGTLILKGGSLFAYTTIKGILTWYPLFQNVSDAYLHTQVLPTTQWVVDHQLGSQYCWYQIKDNSGNILYENSATTSTDGNTTTLIFNEPVAGTVIFVGPNSVVLSNINASLMEVGNVVINTNNITINGVQVLTADSLTAAIDAASTTIETNVITTLRDGVAVSGDTLAKLYSLIQAIQVTLQSDDTTLDTIQELVTRIKSDGDLLSSLTTGKVNVSDIINVLTSTATNVPLSAAQGKVLNDKITALQQGEAVNAIGVVSGAQALDFSLGSYVAMTISAATTLSVTNIPDNTHVYAITLEITNGGSNVTWPSGITWLGTGSAPTLKTSGINMITLITRNGGSSWLGNAS